MFNHDKANWLSYFSPQDLNMYVFLETGIKGGVSTKTKRYAGANKLSMTKMRTSRVWLILTLIIFMVRTQSLYCFLEKLCRVRAIEYSEKWYYVLFYEKRQQKLLSFYCLCVLLQLGKNCTLFQLQTRFNILTTRAHMNKFGY